MGRVVVFGGNGFVGAEVLRALVKRGVPAVSVSRGGLAPKQTADFATEVEWVAGDALKPDSYRSILEGASAVVVAVGSPPLPFVNYGYQVNANGATNEKVLEAAFAANVRRAVVIGATMPQWCPKGYKDGKNFAEAAAKKFADGAADASATVLKPSAIYGTRSLYGLKIPLWPVLGPVSVVLRNAPGMTARMTAARPYLLEGLLVPPVPVSAVAHTVIDALMDEIFAGKFSVLGPDDILARNV
ncbi:hypothetical protein M885DRAFT_569130 [Pelagophyceae sp. CCMP2097]|nr:hypothetical protein M885DRAFT_569130 [Pelagophyceae sp. CCMP2097]